MFCSQCGAEVQPDEKFCPKCGAPNEGYTPVDTAQAAPVKEPVKAAEASTSQSSFPVNTVVGVISPVVVFFSLFLPLFSVSVLGYTETVNFIELMSSADGSEFTVISFIGLIWILLFQLLRHPKISLVGMCALFLDLYLIIATYSGYSGWGVDYGYGFWLFLIGTVGCLIAGFMKVRK